MELEPLAGRLTRGENTVVGYFAQHQRTLAWTPRPAVVAPQRLGGRPSASRPSATSTAFRLPWRAHRRACADLLRWRKSPTRPGSDRVGSPEPVLLDDPTNHLDPGNAPGLTRPCRIHGAVLVVSHDRHLPQYHHRQFLWWPTARSKSSTATWTTTRRLADRITACASAGHNTPVTRQNRQESPAPGPPPRCASSLAPHKRESRQAGKPTGQGARAPWPNRSQPGDSAVYEAARQDELRDYAGRAGQAQGREGQLEETWMDAPNCLKPCKRTL